MFGPRKIWQPCGGAKQPRRIPFLQHLHKYQQAILRSHNACNTIIINVVCTECPVWTKWPGILLTNLLFTVIDSSNVQNKIKIIMTRNNAFLCMYTETLDQNKGRSWREPQSVFHISPVFSGTKKNGGK
jgi:hypothetical protein